MSFFFLNLFFATFGFTSVTNGDSGTIFEEESAHYGDLVEVVIASRAELLLFFNAQKGKVFPSGTPESIAFQNLFTAKESIFEVIQKNSIFVRLDKRLPCKDQKGEDVDASIVSPVQDSICISVGRLLFRLTKTGARPQMLALIASIYSLKAGLSAAQATAIQQQVLSMTVKDSKDHVEEKLLQSARAFQKLRGAIINDENLKSVPKDWNYYCQFVDSLQRYFIEVLRGQTLREFSLFDDVGKPTFYSYFQKVRAAHLGTCSKSAYQPHRAERQAEYNTVFANQKEVSAQVVSTQFNDWIVDSRVKISKIDQVSDLQNEIADFKKYIEEEVVRIVNLTTLYNKYFQY